MKHHLKRKITKYGYYFLLYIHNAMYESSTVMIVMKLQWLYNVNISRNIDTYILASLDKAEETKRERERL